MLPNMLNKNILTYFDSSFVGQLNVVVDSRRLCTSNYYEKDNKEFATLSKLLKTNTEHSATYNKANTLLRAIFREISAKITL